MVNRETINGMVFIAQTTYYVYRSEEDLQNDAIPMLTSSDIISFDAYKDIARSSKEK
jgi:hypothetical protein